MKKKFIVPLFFVLTLSITFAIYSHQSSYSANKRATIVYKDTVHNFGIVRSGDTVKHKFLFKNEGDSSLVIKDVSSSCGCTIPNWTSTPILRGETGSIDVMFTKKNETGLQKRLVIVKANTIPEYTLLRIQANVVK